MKFTFIPKHIGDEFTVYLQLEPQNEDECAFEIEYIENSEGMEVNFESLHPEDILAINSMAENVAAECAHDLFWQHQMDRAEYYSDLSQDR